MKRIYGMAMLAALFALAAAAQDAATQKQINEDLDAAKRQMKVELDTALKTVTVMRMEGGVMSNVKNAPYRADQISESTQTLGDGTRIHNEHQVTIYRDSQGRVRRETPDEVSIMDPNSGAGYTLNTKDLTYRKMTVSVSVNSGTSGDGVFAFRTLKGGAVGAAVLPDVVRSVDDMPMVLTQTVTDGPNTASVTINSQTVAMSPKKESLGTQIMEGVNAQGERRTSTIETGAIGNDRPIQIVSERWYSPDLQVEVMTRHSDPRMGEEITRLANINRAEPDPSLFQVPAGYQLVEGKQKGFAFRPKQ
jgi:hypothetical protein